VHIGDSRIYRLREHTQIELLTEDHSEAADLVRMQIVRPENLRGHPRRHVVTRSLGSEAVARPMAKSGNVQEGDYFVLCTDGLWEYIEDDEVSEVVRFLPVEEACRELVDRVLGRSPTDNISVQVVHILSMEEEPEKAQGSGGLYGAVKRLFGSDE
jgi:protein phosphatase